MSRLIIISAILFFCSCNNETKNNHTINTENKLSKEIVRNGYYEEKYPNGNLWSTCNYKKGAKHGKTSSYYQNGNLRYVGFYKNDEKSDIWLFYSEDGKFVKEVNFSDPKNDHLK